MNPLHGAGRKINRKNPPEPGTSKPKGKLVQEIEIFKNDEGYWAWILTPGQAAVSLGPTDWAGLGRMIETEFENDV